MAPVNSAWVKRLSPPFSPTSATDAANTLTQTAGSSFANASVGDLFTMTFASTTGALSTVSDTRGNTWNIIQTHDAANSIFIGIAWTQLTTAWQASGDTVTFTFAANGNRQILNARVFQVPDGKTVSVDAFSAGADEIATQNVDFGTPTLTYAGELVTTVSAATATIGGQQSVNGQMVPSTAFESAGGVITAGIDIRQYSWIEMPAGPLTFTNGPKGSNVVTSKSFTVAFLPTPRDAWRARQLGTRPINGNSAANTNTGNTITTLMAADYVNIKPGDLLVLPAVCSSAFLGSIFDTSGNQWNFAQQCQNAANSIFLNACYCIVAAPYRASDTITFTWPVSGAARAALGNATPVLYAPAGPIKYDTSAIGADQTATTSLVPGSITAGGGNPLYVAFNAGTAAFSATAYSTFPDVWSATANGSGWGVSTTAWNTPGSGAFAPTTTLSLATTTKGMILSFLPGLPGVKLA